MCMIRLLWGGLLLALCVLPSPGIAGPSATCSHPSCLYLPVVSTGSPVELSEITTARDRAGTVFVQGEVINLTNIPADNVIIEALVCCRENNSTYTVTQRTFLPAVLPGQPNVFQIPFGYLFGDPVPQLLDTRIISWSRSGAQNYRALTVENIRTDPNNSDGIVYVTAEIRNGETVPLTDVVAIAWSLEQADRMNTALVANRLMPGETKTINLTVKYCDAHCPIKVAVQGQAGP